MPKKITSVFVVLLVMLCSLNAYARSDNKGFVSPSMALTGGKLFFAAIEQSMYNECKEQNGVMWDMEQKDRENDYKCVNVFKDFHDSSGLNQYKKADTLAKTSYSKLKRALIAESVAAGGSGEPPEGCDAHHIVPQQDKRKFAQPYAENARAILKECHIDIDSADNGIFLPSRKDGTSQCEGTYHRDLHTEPYYKFIFESLNNAKLDQGCDGVTDALRTIKHNLLNGM